MKKSLKTNWESWLTGFRLTDLENGNMFPNWEDEAWREYYDEDMTPEEAWEEAVYELRRTA